MILRLATGEDGRRIRHLLESAFGGSGEADLVGAPERERALLFMAVAQEDLEIAGAIAFSRLIVETADGAFPAAALAPLAVAPHRRRRGIGASLVGFAHAHLKACGEALSVVLGDPGYYGRFGYRIERAAGFQRPYPPEHLMALAFAPAPSEGRLVYPRAFAGL